MKQSNRNYLLELLLTFNGGRLPFTDNESHVYTRNDMIRDSKYDAILAEYPDNQWFIHISNWDEYQPIHADDHFPFAIIDDYLNGNGYIGKTYLIDAILATNSTEILNTGYILYKTEVLTEIVNLVISNLKDDEINAKQFYNEIANRLMKFSEYPYWIWYNQYTIRPIKTDADLFDLFRVYIGNLFPDE